MTFGQLKSSYFEECDGVHNSKLWIVEIWRLDNWKARTLRNVMVYITLNTGFWDMTLFESVRDTPMQPSLTLECSQRILYPFFKLSPTSCFLSKFHHQQSTNEKKQLRFPQLDHHNSGNHLLKLTRLPLNRSHPSGYWRVAGSNLAEGMLVVVFIYLGTVIRFVTGIFSHGVWGW